MATCFVIQPFDSGKFDKRFNDIYRPAIEAAGLEAYRVDQDPGVQVPIDSIEKGIRQAVVCLADITADNPNVWYELGFAFAAGKPVVMVCSEERTGKKYPFDIQHRSIIPYLADAPSDFDKLRASLTAKIAAIVNQDAVLEKIAEESPVMPVHGLSPPEVLVLAVVAGDAYLPDQATTVNSAKRAAERAGVTNMGFNLAVRRLLQKKFVREQDIHDEQTGEAYAGLAVVDLGWEWIDANEAQFVLTRPDKKDDEILF
ncbi:hypothetical protein [Limnobacter sp. MED105]|uniref:hypothetical protein n=1 Tax=Limnobacter sp. MED105 TaxID=391597 RepID=UPI00030C7F44|nr:hypothetical protein [Limnobacter sp. MED105]